MYEHDGANEPSFTKQVITTNVQPRDIHAADIDGDGDTDILSASEWGTIPNKVAWYENDGGGNFTKQSITDAAFSRSVYAEDINGDSDTDILSAHGNDKVAWYENDGSANFSERALTGPGPADGASSVQAEDIDGDGDTDFFSSSGGDEGIAWYENDGTDDPIFTRRTISTDYPQDIYSADIDGDGDTDVLAAFAVGGGGRIEWYENDGADNPTFTQRDVATDVEFPESVDAADIDGDGDTDVLTNPVNDNGTIEWYENDGNGDPKFTKRRIDTNSLLESVYAADIDGDGDTDIYSYDDGFSDDGRILWYENDGSDNPSFTEREIDTGLSNVSTVYVADVNGDGDADVLSAYEGEFYENKIVWYENDGADDPSFTAREIGDSFATQPDISSFYTSDIDGDGDTDVLSTGSTFYTGQITWHESDGTDDPSFTEHEITTDVTYPRDVDAADINGNGKIDLLSASAGDDKIAWYENGSGAPLPVEMAGLSVRSNGRDAELTWQTASETGNSGFYVQHQGSSQEEWNRLGFVEGAGTTSNPQSYRFMADGLSPGTHEFRLRQVDTDGTVHPSKVVSTEIQMRKKARLSAPAPNPITSTAQFTFAVKEMEKATVTLYNTLGQQVATLYEGRPTPGEQVSLQLDASTLGSGAYIVRLKAGGVLKTRKIIVVK